jgi:hypothetical protein
MSAVERILAYDIDQNLDAFGEPDGNDRHSTITETTAMPTGINAPPIGHNLDDSRLDTGLDSKPELQKPKADVGDPMGICAVTRLLED